MLLSISVISYNTKDLTIQTLRSALRDLQQSSLLKNKTEIIIVDNSSTDGSISALHTFKSESDIPIHLILNTDNRGFGAANNQAIAQAEGKYIFLLNSDTVVEQGAIEKMVQTFENIPDKSTALTMSHRGKIDRLGILAATLKNPDGSSQAQGGSTPTLFSLFCQMSLLDDLPIIGTFLPSTQHTGKRARTHTHKELTAIDWVGGTALMIRKETIEEIGGLDEEIFMYGEDVEWCMRAKDHHWDVAIHNQAFITHFQNQSSSSKNAILGELKGYIYIWSKHKPIWQMPFVRACIKMGIFLRITVFSLLNKPAKANLYKSLAKLL